MTAPAKWVGATFFLVAGLILGVAIAVFCVTSTWGGVFAAVPCADEETNPASMCRNGYYAHGLTGWAVLAVGVVLAIVAGLLGGVLLKTRQSLTQSQHEPETVDFPDEPR